MPRRHELQITFDLSRGVHPAWKQSTTESARTLGRFVYGLSVEDPIDRTGTSPLGVVSKGDELARSNLDVALSGAEGFDPTWIAVRGFPRFSWTNLTSEDSQIRTIEHCEEIANLKSVVRNEATGKGEVLFVLVIFHLCKVRAAISAYHVYPCLNMH